MIQIPAHIDVLTPYKPGKPSNDMFDGQRLEGSAILCSNENNLGPSPKALAAISQAVKQLHLYPDPLAAQLRSVLSKKVGRPEDHFIFGNGSDGILYTLFKAFFEPGDTLLTSEGSFIAVKSMASIHKTPYLAVPMAKGYRFDLDAILERIDDYTKVIYLCNPNNPTGTFISEEALNAFLAQVPKHILVIVDEAYFEYAQYFTDAYPDSTRLAYENVLTLRTFSKVYGLAGVRLGYGIAQPHVISALSKVKLTFNPSLLAQAAGIGALSDTTFLESSLRLTQDGLAYFYEAFETLAIPFVHSYANFVMMDFGSEARVEHIYEALRQEGVLIRRLGSFGLPHCARVSVGLRKENERFVEVLTQVLKKEASPSLS